MIVVIGSTALNFRIPGFRAKVSDVDLIMTYDTFVAWHKKQINVESVYPIESGKKFVVKFFDQPIHEIELAKPGNSCMMILEQAQNWTASCMVAQKDWDHGVWHIPPIDILYTIKMSHRYLKDSPFFYKTMEDISRLRAMGHTSVDEKLLKLREAETYEHRLPRLNQSKKDFFTGDSVKYIYDHDSLHEAVKIGERPAYSYFKPEDSEVMVSKKMFFALPYDIQINSVLEEAYVLALERSQIPFNSKISQHASFKIALSKVCTSITSGWWREFAYNNYFVVLGRYTDNYLAKFDKALADGIIKPFTGSKY